jgi:glucose/arabinose dehydrogenase
VLLTEQMRQLKIRCLPMVWIDPSALPSIPRETVRNGFTSRITTQSFVFRTTVGISKRAATGIRNGAGIAVNPDTGELWSSTNERDGLGDDLVPDYITRVKAGAFYGWPWFYMGAHEDPRHANERPDLAGRVIDPDVLLQSHSAPLEMCFYTASTGVVAFPAEYRGDIFAALHGSWNRSSRTGYKVVRVLLDHGVPTGKYVDFLTGFVVNDRSVWGRPVGVAVAHDGALLVTEDGNGTLWRVSYMGR